MNEIFNKKRELEHLIQKIHKNSHYLNKDKPKLIAVSKQQPEEKIKAALEIGHRIFGENKIQEAIHRWSSFINKYDNLELHFIGHLQSNKVRKALNFFHVIHSIDRESLAVEISKYLTNDIKTKCFMIQVNTGEEKTKSGVHLDKFEAFFEFTKSLKIPITGLMCLPPVNDNPSIHFCILKKLADKFRIKYLSMGMSNDFEQAIKFGSTHLRIGNSFFGKRINP